MKEFDKVHAKPVTVKKKRASEKNALQRRGSSFSAEEALMVSKAVMKSSQDRIKGTDKKKKSCGTKFGKHILCYLANTTNCTARSIQINSVHSILGRRLQ